MDGHFVNACVRFFLMAKEKEEEDGNKRCTPNACKYSLTHSNDLYYFCLVSSRFLSASFEFLFPHFYAQTSCLWQQLMTEDQTYFFRFFFLANAHGLWFFKKKKFGIHNLSHSLHFKSSSFLCCFVGFLSLFRLTLRQIFSFECLCYCWENGCGCCFIWWFLNVIRSLHE